MSLNENLRKAKRRKNDEFYTQLSDMRTSSATTPDISGARSCTAIATIPASSNFFHYFSYNFERLGLKKLITACYRNQERDLFSRHDSERAIWLEYKGEREGRQGA